MKNILLPTDFSAASYTALLYAADLAEQQQAQLVLLHVFQKPIYWFDTPTEILQKEGACRLESQRKLEALQNSPTLSGRHLKITFRVRNGQVANVIAETIRELNSMMVVMGSPPCRPATTSFTQTIPTEVIEKTSCPVLVIPPGVPYRPIRHIVSAIGYHDSDLLHTIELTEIASLFEADITLLHISEETPAVSGHSLEELRTKACTHTRYDQVHTQLLEGGDFIQQLDHYAEQRDTDLIVMASKHRSALGKVYGYSFTKEMMLRTKWPLLVYKAFDLEAFPY
jgi:nucleotide-binding universal stress UspA family protein